MLPSIHIGDISISTFVATLSMGAFGMFACVLIRRRRYALSIFQSVLFTILLTCVGVAGAKLLFTLENGLQTWDGVSFFGSVFLIPPVMSMVGLLFRQRPSQTLDLCAPCVAIMIACLRIGCFLTGCCGGRLVWIGNIPFSWPTQTMESIGDIVILIWLLQQEEAENARGKLYPFLMISYSIMRFLLEFLRDTPKDWLLMSHGQWFSLSAIAVGLIWLTTQKRGNHNEHRT